MEGETGALNESHMFPKMEAFQAAWAHGPVGAERLAPLSSPTHGCAPSTRFRLAPLCHREANAVYVCG